MFKVNSLKGRIFLLTGFMCAGKTFIGKETSKLLNISFVDLDSYIEKQQNKSINDIFNSYGEKYFRELETKCFLEVIRNNLSRTIVAVGGGFPLKEENQLLMLNNTTIYIDIDFNVILSRLNKDEKAKRPKIKNLLADDIKKVYEERLPIYKSTADYVAHNLDEVVNYIKEKSIPTN